MLSLAIAFQCFQPISGWNGQVFDSACDPKAQQFDLRHSRNPFEFLDPNSCRHFLGIFILIRSDHNLTMPRTAYNVKRTIAKRVSLASRLLH